MSDNTTDILQKLEQSIALPSPLQSIIVWNEESNTQVNYYIKRDDLIDPYISGNKYRKLKGQISKYLKNRRQYGSGILTYGGAYSNHLYATAAVCDRLDIPMTAIVRGEEADLSNHTLSYLIKTDAIIHKISRTDYRLKSDAPIVQNLLTTGQYLEIQEGGNAVEAKVGVAELSKEITSNIKADYICIASGTGTTARYILESIKGTTTRLVICSAVRDSSVKADIKLKDTERQVVWIDEQWGGFGKKKPGLLDSMKHLESVLNIPLEYVYTGKLLTEIDRLRKSGYFRSGSNVVVIHTGGLRPSSQDLMTRG